MARDDPPTPDLLDGERSIKGRRWTLRAPDAEAVERLSRESGVGPTLARLLAGRGVVAEDVPAFLTPRLRDALPDPSSLADMDAAASALMDAVEADRAVTVFADYDVDGGTSAAQLIRWARAMGREWELYVPDRILEGYGPSREAFETLKAQGRDLVVTVDCGAAAKLELKAAADIDLDVVVIDHHLMHGDLPPAVALVNPNRPDDESGLGQLAAAGVSFLLLVALNREARRRGHTDVPNLMDFLGLAALGTVCDVVPLTGVNRAIVHQGLKVLSRRQQPGVGALAEVARAGREFTIYDLGFLLGPRINAGGRIGKADMGARLLSEDGPEVAEYAAELDRVNTERRAIQDQIQREALEQANRLDHPDLPILVLADESWHPGVIGVVSGRLKERFGKPVILIGTAPDGPRAGQGKGSGRSVKGMNLGDAITGAKEDGLLMSGGGHAMAGGLSMDLARLGELRSHLEEALSEEWEVARRNSSSSVDLVVSPSAVDLSLVGELETVGPYGAGNPKPVVAVSDVRLVYADRLRGGHVRLTFEDAQGGQLRAIAFRAHESGIERAVFAPQSGNWHVLGTVRRDTFRGNERADFHVLDLARAEGPLAY